MPRGVVAVKDVVMEECEANISVLDSTTESKIKH
jgi:hypothetical protein